MARYNGDSCGELSSLESEAPSFNIRSNMTAQLSETVSDPMEVYLRIRNRTSDEIMNQVPMITYSIQDETILECLATKYAKSNLNKYNHRYTFTKIFDRLIEQEEIFETVAKSIVREFLEGNNRLLFNYGVTNAGKTYTMHGTANEPGIVPRSLDLFFQLIGDKISVFPKFKPQDGTVVKLSLLDAAKECKIKKEILKMDIASTSFNLNSLINSSRMISDGETSSILSHSSASMSLSSCGSHVTKYCVWVSFVEIYSEQVFDLIGSLLTKTRKMLKLRESHNGAFLQGVTEIAVNTPEEAYKLLLLGQQVLKQASTKLNQSSSRSHCIYTLKLVPLDEKDNLAAEVNQLSFCDLAGSERYSKTQNCGERLREAAVINTSLMVLGRCVAQLRQNQLSGHENVNLVPFRDSKLTKILKAYLTGHGKACMLINISPCVHMYDETQHVLKFSAKAKELILSDCQSFLKNCNVSRSSIMSLRKSLLDRSSIPWEDTELEYNDQNEPNQKSDSTISDIQNLEDTEQLLEMIELLKQHIVKLEQEQLQQEIEIREELCNAFSKQLKDTEDYYRDRLAEEQDDAEEMTRRRLENAAEYYRSKKCPVCTQRETSQTKDASTMSEVDEQTAEANSGNKVIENLINEISKLKDELMKTEQENLKLVEVNKNVPIMQDASVEVDLKDSNSFTTRSTQYSFDAADINASVSSNSSMHVKDKPSRVSYDKTLYFSVIASSDSGDEVFKMPETPVASAEDKPEISTQTSQTSLIESDVTNAIANEMQKQFASFKSDFGQHFQALQTFMSEILNDKASNAKDCKLESHQLNLEVNDRAGDREIELDPCTPQTSQEQTILTSNKDQTDNTVEIISEEDESYTAPVRKSKRKLKKTNKKETLRSIKRFCDDDDDSSEEFDSVRKPKAKKHLHRGNQTAATISPMKSPVTKPKQNVHQKVLRSLRQRK